MRPLKTFNRFKRPSRSKVIKAIDAAVSQIIRIRDHWACIRCHHQYTPPTLALHCSHYYSRRYLGTRWDLDNLDALCFGCHRLVEGDKQGWYTQFKKKQLGPKPFEKLEIKAYSRTTFSYDDLQMLLTLFETKLKEMENRKT